ncbi:hypothetical protein ACFQ23_07585 [Schaalia naturae]|jgi:hypothetical protein|uniref:Uncharacterized protein n=1 Tax=Schaalia naturae TaxID=635203 RepID=A0ABW2SNU3_9ACTO
MNTVLFDTDRQEVTEVAVWEDADGIPAAMQATTHHAEVTLAEDGTPVAFWTREDLT